MFITNLSIYNIVLATISKYPTFTNNLASNTETLTNDHKLMQETVVLSSPTL